jgi:hypothetical protein
MGGPEKKKGAGAKPEKRSTDTTLVFKITEPQVEQFSFVATPKQLKSFRKYLSSFILRQNNASLIFENFVNNLRGVSQYPEFRVVRTRSNFFMLSSNYDKEASVLWNQRSGEILYVSRISFGDLRRLTSDAVPGTPVMSEKELRMMLMYGKVVEGNFDLCSLAESLSCVGSFNDDNNVHYVIAGEGSFAYILYIDSEPLGNSEVVCRFEYQDEKCTLCKENMII